MLTGAAQGGGGGTGGDPPAGAVEPEKPVTEPDTAPENLRRRLRERGVPQATASLAIGRHKAYLPQYLSRGIPRVLSWHDSAALAELLDCDPDLLRHAERPPPRRRKRKPPSGASRLAAVPEIERSAEADARGGEAEREKVRWQMPEAMIREEFGAEPANLRIVRVSGEAMEPALREGDRLVVDTAKHLPGDGGLFVLRGPGGFEVWRVQPHAGTDFPRLRLSCANPRYQARTRLAGKVDILGKAIWKITRQ